MEIMNGDTTRRIEMICKACKADALIHVARYGNMPKHIKCPHGVCWCEYPKEKRNNWNVSIIGKDGLPEPVWDIIFCPVCSRKLED